MRWNLRMAAAERGIWKASEHNRMLRERGLVVISTGKMSGWWSGRPTGIKFAELDVLCATLGCTIADLDGRRTGQRAPPRRHDRH